MSGYVKAKDIRKTFLAGKNSVEVLKGVSLEIERGEWVALLGASGSGKTTLLDIIGTLGRPDSGELEIAGKVVSGLSPALLAGFRREKIGFVFQAFHLLPELNILENVMLPAVIAGMSRTEAEKRAGTLLERAGLGGRIPHRPNELSGGEQQRAAIARALVNRPELLLADEPTGNLDSVTGKGILELFRDIHDESGATIIMVTHDSGVAALAGRRIVLKDGVTCAVEKTAQDL